MDRHSHHHHQAVGDADTAEVGVQADILDLDAEVLSSYLTSAIDRVHDLARQLPVRRILDIGAGTGSAAVILAQRFAGADVVAVDQSAEMLARLEAKAAGLGLAGRVLTVEANLDESWPAIDRVDVAWASRSMHHLAEPGRVLEEIFAAVNPGGVLAVAEMSGHVRFLPDDIGIGSPGLEARCQAALQELMRVSLPHLGADWGLLIAGAGFADVAEQVFDIDLTAPLPASAGRYAREQLRRMRNHISEAISADDLAVLDGLVGDGPDSVLHRQDLAIRGRRTLWTAIRP